MRKYQTEQNNGKKDENCRCKVMDGLVLAVGVCAMTYFGLTAQAAVPEDLWEYTTGTNADGTIYCDFKEVSVNMPSLWSGKCGITRGEDSVSFHHLESRKAMRNAGWGNDGGRLFTLCWSEDYQFMEVIPHYQILGEGDYGVYYVDFPTDVQGYSEDDAIWSEWTSLVESVEWVADHMEVTPYGETDAEGSEWNSYQDAEEYILPDSSRREIDSQELQAMTYDELQMAINEIYARHHRKFVWESVQAYFDSRSWYTGTIEAADFDPALISELEWKNIRTIQKVMKQKK